MPRFRVAPRRCGRGGSEPDYTGEMSDDQERAIPLPEPLRRHVERLGPPVAWDPRVPEIPWHRPDFSARMLEEHLSQRHDLASRRAVTIGAQVARLATLLPPGGSLLDAACGPGLYATRLAARGYRVTGIDISPAAIAHARANAVEGCRYYEGDLLTLELGDRFDGALLLYGLLHAFRPSAAAGVLARLRRHLAPGAPLLVELRAADNWDTASYEESWAGTADLYSSGRYRLYYEHRWDPTLEAEVERYSVLHEDGTIDSFAVSERRLSEARLAAMLRSAGLVLEGVADRWPSERDGAWELVIARAPRSDEEQ